MFLDFVNNRSLFALKLGIFAFIITSLSEFVFTHDFSNKVLLSLGTGFCTFIAVYLMHLLLFKFLKSLFYKITLIIIFPLLYILLLISFFGFVSGIFQFKLFQVDIVHQIYLQIWFFLAQGYFYLSFSPKIPLFITTTIIMVLLFQMVRLHNSQPHSK